MKIRPRAFFAEKRGHRSRIVLGLVASCKTPRERLNAASAGSGGVLHLIAQYFQETNGTWRVASRTETLSAAFRSAASPYRETIDKVMMKA